MNNLTYLLLEGETEYSNCDDKRHSQPPTYNMPRQSYLSLILVALPGGEAAYRDGAFAVDRHLVGDRDR